MIVGLRASAQPTYIMGSDPDMIYPSDKKYNKVLEKNRDAPRKMAALLIHYCF